MTSLSLEVTNGILMIFWQLNNAALAYSYLYNVAHIF